MRAELRKLHYAMAGVPVPEPHRAPLHFIDTGRLHSGSDGPFTETDGCEQVLEELEAIPLPDARTREGMMWRNAHRLFPARFESGRARR